MLTIPEYAYYTLLGGHGHLQAAAAGAQGAAADGRAAPHAAGPPIARAVGGWRRGAPCSRYTSRNVSCGSCGVRAGSG
eukprot:scaffold71287_cov57-Phaeocystis_antarctica.AAC.2